MPNQKIDNIFNFKEKIILITGSSGQIGSSFCKLFLDLGAKVYGFDKISNNLNHKNFFFKKLDITNKNIVERNINAIVSKNKSVDVIINNAGYSVFTKFYKRTKKDSENINFYEQLFLILLVYFLISIFISIPYYFSQYNLSLIDSYFESVSGLTGTGFTIFKNIKFLDDPLILWRSTSQWIGGFYFLIFLILIFSNKQFNFKMIDFSFNLEKKINFSSNLINVTNRIFLIYISITIIIFTLFFKFA